MLGRTYEQLLPFVTPEADKRSFVVVEADFVTLDSGTGIVHMAPAFGEDDYQVGRRENLSFFRPVDANGEFTAEIEPWAGLQVKKANRPIIKHLAAAGKLNAAFKMLKKAIGGKKTDPEIWVRLSGIYGAQGSLNLTRECCEKALELNQG